MAAWGRRPWRWTAGLPVIALTLAACGGGDEQPHIAPTAAGSDQVRVGLLDYSFQRSATALASGAVELRVTNAGSTPHDLQLLDGTTVIAATRILHPGQSETITADLSGLTTVTFLCTVPGHRQMGMVEDVDVLATPTTSGSSAPSPQANDETKEARVA